MEEAKYNKKSTPYCSPLLIDKAQTVVATASYRANHPTYFTDKNKNAPCI